jgi:RNase P/RNase MRP subunit p29
MNVVGQTVTVVASPDQTKVGRTGVVVLESAKTLVLSHGGKAFRVEKARTAFKVKDTQQVILGSDIAGRLEDRWSRTK